MTCECGGSLSADPRYCECGAPAAPRASEDEPGAEEIHTVNEHIMQFFAYEHLPENLQAISRPFARLADVVVTSLPRNPERTVALRKLLEAKDAAVRAAIAKDAP